MIVEARGHSTVALTSREDRGAMRLALGTMAILTACVGQATTPAPTPPGTIASPESGVYAALVDAIHERRAPDTLLLGDSTLAFRVSRDAVPSWRAEFDSIPATLATLLETVSAAKRSSAALPMPRPVRIVTSAELSEIFESRGRGGWQEFYRRYPRQRSYLRFTPVAFSADTLDALVYYEYYCGGLCGWGSAVWLRRQSNGRWQVQKTVGFWIS